jgi:hypothetical protein
MKQELVLMGAPFASIVTIFDDEEIKALPTTPGVIVAATETLNYAGFPSALIVPVKVFGVLDTTEGAYTNVTDGCPVLYWGSDLSHAVAQATLTDFGNSTLQLNTGNVGPNLFSNNSPGKCTFSMFILEGTLGPEALQDNALVFSLNNLGNLTDGNPANSLKLIVQYQPVNV